VGEEELRAANRKSSDDVPSVFQVLQEFRAECGLVEVDRNVSVADSQHGRDLSPHRVPRA